jgi:general secretion pathway protein N
MRVDNLAPKTWLLAAVAVWALCLWALAMAGMGSRLGGVPEDVAQQRLPTTQLPNGERPGPLVQYSEIASRPLFSENRQPQPFTIDGNGQEAPSNPFDYILTSVLMTPAVQLAILRPPGDGTKPVRVKLGEAVESAPQWTLASLQPRQAVFRGPEGEKTMELRVFDGVGAIVPIRGVPNPNSGMPPPPPPMPPGQQAVPIAEAGMPPPGAMPPGAMPQPADGGMVQPQPVPGAPPVPASADNVSTQQQLEAIRKRIEARRAQLRQQNQSPQSPPGR